MAETILVIGAGITGAAIAHRLAGAGATVTVLDAGLPAGGASGRSFGWINANNYLTEEHFHLRVAAMEAFRAAAADMAPVSVDWCGAISWEEAGEALHRTAATLGDLGYPLRILDRRAFATLEPGVANPPEEAILYGAEGAVDLSALTERLLTAAAAHGARLCIGTPVTGLHLTAGRVGGVETAEGVIRADRVVVAAGTGSATLLASAGIALPMLRRPGLLMRTRPVARAIRHILASPEQELRQDAAGRILAPTSPAHQSDDATDIWDLPTSLAEATLGRLRRMLPGATLDWEQVTLAFRPVPGDGLPVVGETSVEGLYAAVMHSGATLAPLIGQLVAREIAKGEVQPMLSPFRPARFR
ncbi:MAG: FAD-binding oxidoreductase [Rhodobacteraceae bacterium]|nr:FAD-binding oxidoreductase [Paracoccaceae bacterium]